MSDNYENEYENDIIEIWNYETCKLLHTINVSRNFYSSLEHIWNTKLILIANEKKKIKEEIKIEDEKGIRRRPSF